MLGQQPREVAAAGQLGPEARRDPAEQQRGERPPGRPAARSRSSLPARRAARPGRRPTRRGRARRAAPPAGRAGARRRSRPATPCPARSAQQVARCGPLVAPQARAVGHLAERGEEDGRRHVGSSSLCVSTDPAEGDLPEMTGVPKSLEQHRRLVDMPTASGLEVQVRLEVVDRRRPRSDAGRVLNVPTDPQERCAARTGFARTVHGSNAVANRTAAGEPGGARAGPVARRHVMRTGARPISRVSHVGRVVLQEPTKRFDGP